MRNLLLTAGALLVLLLTAAGSAGAVEEMTEWDRRALNGELDTASRNLPGWFPERLRGDADPCRAFVRRTGLPASYCRGDGRWSLFRSREFGFGYSPGSRFSHRSRTTLILPRGGYFSHREYRPGRGTGVFFGDFGPRGFYYERHYPGKFRHRYQGRWRGGHGYRWDRHRGEWRRHRWKHKNRFGKRHRYKRYGPFGPHLRNPGFGRWHKRHRFHRGGLSLFGEFEVGDAEVGFRYRGDGRGGGLRFSF